MRKESNEPFDCKKDEICINISLMNLVKYDKRKLIKESL